MATEQTPAPIDRKRLRSQRLREVNVQGDALRLGMNWTVKNTGSVAGADAAQVYVGPPGDTPAGIEFAVRSLAQFDRVELDPGQSKTETLHIAPRQLSYWSEALQQWVLDAGGRSVWVGDADAPANLPLEATLAAAPASLTCSDQQINATTINGDLTVNPGDWCDLVDVTVKGDLNLNQASGVRVAGSTITGDLEATNTSGSGDPMSGGANVICNTTVSGNVHVHGSAASSPWRIGSCGPTSVGGNLQFQQNAATGNTITGTTVQGNVICVQNADVTGSGNTFGGSAKARGQCASI